MTLWLRDLMDRYDQLSLRERVLVLAATLLLLALVWNSTFIAPLDKERKSKVGLIEAVRAEISGLEQSIEALVAQGATEGQQPSHASADALKAEIEEMDRRLAGVTSGLIAPKEMSQVLEQVLGRAKRLTLLSLRTLPPEAVIAPGSDAVQSGAASAAQIYKHGVELELTGGYLEALYFLQSLEALPWRFLWDRVEYTADGAKGTLKLRVYTLGLDEGWIGV